MLDVFRRGFDHIQYWIHVKDFRAGAMVSRETEDGFISIPAPDPGPFVWTPLDDVLRLCGLAVSIEAEHPQTALLAGSLWRVAEEARLELLAEAESVPQGVPETAPDEIGRHQ
jgi:hypothetical protein